MSKTALITGASRGIGAAIAKRLAKDGFNIVINYRNSIEEAMRLENVLAGYGVKTLTWKADVAAVWLVLESDISIFREHGMFYSVFYVK